MADANPNGDTLPCQLQLVTPLPTPTRTRSVALLLQAAPRQSPLSLTTLFWRLFSESMLD